MNQLKRLINMCEGLSIDVTIFGVEGVPDEVLSSLGWTCRECKIYGVILLKPFHDVWQVMHQVEEHHKELAPNCDTLATFPKL